MAILPALCALALCVTGCDFLRTVAGRPTSAQLVETSSPSAEAESCSSCAACKACVGTGCCPCLETLPQKPEHEAAEEVHGLKSLYMLKLGKDSIKQTVSGLPYKYYVLIGTFTRKSYADEQVHRAVSEGFEVVTIPFSEGKRTAVAVSPTNDLDFAVSELDRVKKFAFCPADAYIMLAE